MWIFLSTNCIFLEGESMEWDIWATHETCISDDITLSTRITRKQVQILYVSKSFALFHMAL